MKKLTVVAAALLFAGLVTAFALPDAEQTVATRTVTETVTVTRPAPPPPPAPGAEFGVVVGSGSDTSSFEAWVPRPVVRVVGYTGRATWFEVENPTWVRRYDAQDISLSVALIPTRASLSTCANGSYASHYTALANNLVAWGHENAILRLGWEFNATWFAWKAGGNQSDYAACFRSAVTAMRAVSPAFRFDWCVVNRGANPEPAYPGDDYVDYIGNDVFDQSWVPSYTDPAARWNDIENGAYGLAWQAAFATAHDKQLSFPEWGLTIRSDGHGGGDNTHYIERMHRWISTHNTGYHAYFEVDAPDGQHALMTGRFPRGAARFRELWASES